jgi:RHS repeat-associated protein
VGTETHAIVWNGWQPIEEYKNGQLTSRRTYGAGLDEIVQLETHLDSAQADTYVPLYDHAGNLIAATGLNGKAIERYAYSTYGVAKVRVDSSAREEQLAMRKGTALWLLGSEEVSDAALAQAVADHSLKLESQFSQTSAAVALKDAGTWQSLEIQVTQPAVNESQEGHRIVIAPIGQAIAEGTQLRLTVPPSALTDLFLNRPAQPFELTFAWPADDGVVFDSTATPQSAAFAALKTGSASAEIGDSIEPPDDRDSAATTISNPFNFQGLPRDPETGFVYMRNRYYDPELGRFITVDPLVYVDGPNAYGFAVNDPVNGSDPLGLLDLPFCARYQLFCAGVASGLRDFVKAAVSTPVRLWRADQSEWSAKFQAYGKGGYGEWRRVSREATKVHNEAFKEMVPGVGSGRRLGEAWEACTNGGQFECGQKVVPAGVSLGGDVAVAGAATRGTLGLARSEGAAATLETVGGELAPRRNFRELSSEAFGLKPTRAGRG